MTFWAAGTANPAWALSSLLHGENIILFTKRRMTESNYADDGPGEVMGKFLLPKVKSEKVNDVGCISSLPPPRLPQKSTLKTRHFHQTRDSFIADETSPFLLAS